MSHYTDSVIADSPASYWRLGESSGNTAYPLVGASNGTYNGPLLGQSGLLPRESLATSVYFDGSNDYITTPGACGVSSAPCTVEFWVKPDQDAMIGVFDSAPTQTNVVRNYPSDSIEWWGNTAITFNFVNGTVYHVVATFVLSGGTRTIKLYVNGSLQANQSYSNPAGMAVSSWRFGDINNGTAGRFKGWLQDLALYNKELSGTRVAAHYLAGQRNVYLGQTVPMEKLESIAPIQKIPLWSDGVREFHSYPAAPPIEFWGRTYAINDVPLEYWHQHWVNRNADVPVSVDLGWLHPVDTLPFGAAGWLYNRKKLPAEMGGGNGVVHTWHARRPTSGVLPHLWNVAEVVQDAALSHTWSVQTEQGGQVPHLWRVLNSGLVAARARDIQLPTATRTITTNG
jgi:hypothetical protein